MNDHVIHCIEGMLSYSIPCRAQLHLRINSLLVVMRLLDIIAVRQIIIAEAARRNGQGDLWRIEPGGTSLFEFRRQDRRLRRPRFYLCIRLAGWANAEEVVLGAAGMEALTVALREALIGGAVDLEDASQAGPRDPWAAYIETLEDL